MTKIDWSGYLNGYTIGNLQGVAYNLIRKIFNQDHLIESLFDYIIENIKDPEILIADIYTNLHAYAWQIFNFNNMNKYDDEFVVKIFIELINGRHYSSIMDHISAYMIKKQSLALELYDKIIPIYVKQVSMTTYIGQFIPSSIINPLSDEFRERYFDALIAADVDPETLIIMIAKKVTNKDQCETLLNYTLLRYDFTINQQFAVKLIAMTKK
jgi:hypothetical protein